MFYFTVPFECFPRRASVACLGRFKQYICNNKIIIIIIYIMKIFNSARFTLEYFLKRFLACVTWLTSQQENNESRVSLIRGAFKDKVTLIHQSFIHLSILYPSIFHSSIIHPSITSPSFIFNPSFINFHHCKPSIRAHSSVFSCRQ